MKEIKSLMKKIKALVQKERGSALVVALIIMLALTLLGLSLLLQSNTEYAISINERDSTAALYNAEAALQLAKARLGTFGPNVSDALDGADNAGNTLDDGIINIRTALLTDTNQLITTNEQTDSAIVTLPDGEQYEAFRIGVDTSDPLDGVWDGPRGLVFVRVEDNYDDEPAANVKWTDQDRRVNAHVISQYPIRVDSIGTELSPSKTFHFRLAGVSTRELVARFGPAETQAAIVSKKDMELDGSLHVCGACGSVHANQDLTIDGDLGFHICQNATESNDDPDVTGGTIDGTVGNSGPIFVPVANPFHEDYAPKVEWFNTLTPPDPELASFTDLMCPALDITTNPGGSKYFALVGDGGDGLVYKAYWDPSSTPPRWTWKLIDDLNDDKDTALDACGRVVSGNVNDVDLTPDTGATLAEPIDDAESAQNKSFYGFDYKHGSGLNACAENNDGTLGPASAENNFVDNDYFLSLPGIPTDAILPGTYHNGSDVNDDYEAGEWYGKGDRLWKSNASDVYAPMYNAVIFVSGNLTLTGNLNNLCTFDGCAPLPPASAGVWRVTFVALGNINASGGPRYAPVRSFDVIPNNQYMMVAGRDIELSGTPGEGDICPANCEDPPANLAGYAGIILAHEQIKLTGNVAVNGIIQAEDEAQCADLVSGAGIQATGSVEVYYDCVHPPNNGAENTTMTSWEEVQ